jgi:serpin B
MKKWIEFAVILACSGLLSQAAVGDLTNTGPLVKSNTIFAAQLYARLRNTPSDILCAPYSLSTTLAMTWAGARGSTARQMEQALHLPEGNKNVHAMFRQLDTALARAQTNGNLLVIANSLWPASKYPILEDYASLLKTQYRSSITPLDYIKQSEQARATINQWVDEKTSHKIQEIVPAGSLNDLSRFILVNAVYFKGLWNTPFPISATRPEKFYDSSSKTLTVPTMRALGTFLYRETTNMQLVVLPYKGQQLEMLLLLPRKRDGMAALEKSLDRSDWTTLTTGTKPETVAIDLPKFNFTTQMELSEALAGMGIVDAFSPEKADFSGIDAKPRWLFLNKVIQKAFIEVNETGTEAAAVTMSLGHTNSVTPMPAKQFIADHPFLFFIRERSTGCIFFMGRLNQPLTAGAPLKKQP